MKPSDIDSMPWREVVTLATLAGGMFWRANRLDETGLWYWGEYGSGQVHPIEEENRKLHPRSFECGFKTKTAIARAYLKWFVTQGGSDASV
jgi:hypothetical protein